jgi:hypothetical protein
MTSLWILQELLAMVSVGTGTSKLIKTHEELLSMGSSMAWTADFRPQTSGVSAR